MYQPPSSRLTATDPSADYAQRCEDLRATEGRLGQSHVILNLATGKVERCETILCSIAIEDVSARLQVKIVLFSYRLPQVGEVRLTTSSFGLSSNAASTALPPIYFRKYASGLAPETLVVLFRG